MIVFTICARNFLAQAITLYESLRRHNPRVRFYVALCDSAENFDVKAFPFEILGLEQLGIPKLEAMIGNYNITELNTSIKPFVFSYLFDVHPTSVIIYLDPDIYVCGSFDELEAEIQAGADCILTPHITEPAEFSEMTDKRLLQFGIYNLGFCALRDTPLVRRIVGWWGRRLEVDCVIDLPQGLFVDQKWADFLPAYIERTKILRHPGYNVAYWNLAQRTVRKVGGEWYANDGLLRFVHFSGSRIDPPVFSRHSSQFVLGNLRHLRELFEEYCEDVKRRGFYHFGSIAYGFSWGGAAEVNEHTPSPAYMAKDHRGLTRGTILPEDPVPYLPLTRAQSLSEYRHALANQSTIMPVRRAVENLLVPEGRDVFEVTGHCVVCGQDSEFRVGNMYALGHYADGRFLPNWREHLDCISCGYVSRIRATLHVLEQEVAPAASWRVYLTEQVTPLFKWFSDRFQGTVGSEYLGSGHLAGAVVDGIRHEDIQALSFSDASFDLVVSLDVLEHVPEPAKALRELRRCLRPGGVLLLSAPFKDQQYEHEVRAVCHVDGTVEHLMPPEYHGNPVDPETGALCFNYFGWRLIDDLRAAGFASAECICWWSRDYAYLGRTNCVFLALA